MLLIWAGQGTAGNADREQGAAGVLVSSDCLSGDNFTGAVIILLSNDR